MVDNLRTKKGKLILSITTTFSDGQRVDSETFNSSFLKDDIYFIYVRSNSVSTMSFLIKRDSVIYTSPIIQARGLSSSLILDRVGVKIFGNVENIVGLEIYELTIN